MAERAAFYALTVLAVVAVRARRGRRRRLGYDLAERIRKQLYAQGAQVKNHYFLVRHGESEANEQGVISSDPQRGCQTHGLTAKGVEQAEAAGAVLKEWLQQEEKPWVVLSSDFRRARETAEVVARGVDDVNGHEKISLKTALRERRFGLFEMTSNKNYALVWEFDKDDIYHEEYEAESVASVAARAGQLIVDCERAHEGHAVILVAHGDVLQILRSTVEAVRPPALHRSGRHLGTASVTKLKL